MPVRLSPSVRIFPPSVLTQHHWIAEDAAGPQRWRVPMTTVVALLAAAAPVEQDRLAGQIVDRTGVDQKVAAATVQVLLEIGLLSDDAVPLRDRQRRFRAISSRWAEKGWTEAADYHAGTFDYPFVDYAAGGRAVDTARMNGYVLDEPDDVRYKDFPEAPATLLPAPVAELAPSDLAAALTSPATAELDAQSLSSILSLSFGQTGTITAGRWQRIPMMRRTSPSGGARHPCEAYVVVIDVPGMEAGVHHVHPVGPKLQLISEGAPSMEQLADAFPAEYFRLPHKLAAIIVITGVFARNMYRYREPRTFRTVHNDAGHLAATAQLVASALRVRSYVEYAGNDEAVEALLGIDGISEGFLLTITLTGPDTDPDFVERRRAVLTTEGGMLR